MDTSEQYIKMCDCKEIQKQWVSRSGDFYTLSRDGKGRIYVFFGLHDSNFLWLPRQDQLQEILDIHPYKAGFNLHYWTQSLLKFMETNTLGYSFGQTMEQLWLGFVMKEKYHKKWSNEKDEWIDY